MKTKKQQAKEEEDKFFAVLDGTIETLSFSINNEVNLVTIKAKDGKLYYLVPKAIRTYREEMIKRGHKKLLELEEKEK